jgi:hypothetical protein
MRKLLTIALALTITISLTFAIQPPSAAQEDEKLSATEQRLLDVAARNQGLAASELQLLDSTTVNLPLTNRTVNTAKIVSARDENVLAASIDERGEEVDLALLKQEEERAYIAKYGKLDPALYDRVQGLRSAERVKVAFWMNPVEDLDREEFRDGRTDLSREEVKAVLARRSEQVRAATARATERFSMTLRGAGFTLEERGDISPVVYATIPVGQLEAYAERADVQRVYLAENRNEDYMNIAAPSIQANWVWFAGFTGVDTGIAIVEDSRVDFDNNCLVNNLGTRVANDANVDTHATATAGMAASTNSTHRGIAYGAGIYSANGTDYTDPNMSAALDAAANNADILNNSWGPGCGGADGSMNVHARHADYIVRYVWDTVTAAAGNNGNCSGGEFVGGIANGYNVIAVGNYDDKGTTSSSDNTMNTSSSYRNPTSTHNDREKPEVAAPGTNITSLLMTDSAACPTGDVGSGTSYSAPMVAGVAALLMDAVPSFKYYPETVKAVIMAGAINNVEGSAALSDRDGAGGVNALSSTAIVANNNYTWRYVTPSSFDANGYITIDMGWVEAYHRVKVALVWDSNPSSDYTTDPLNADLDLNVVGPGVNVWSSRWDNSYETVDFTAPFAGNYSIKIKNFRFNGTNEYVAVAWNK